jgi:hypothetical protein|tara:strand:+ start:1289 stop:1537 length:249 start_codon:yes stop_codon:yes gene_type:complete
MIVSIKNDDGMVSYDINSIDDKQRLQEAKIIVSKVGNLETVTEALGFASATHRANLEKLLADSPEALVEESTIEERETSDEE